MGKKEKKAEALAAEPAPAEEPKVRGVPHMGTAPHAMAVSPVGQRAPRMSPLRALWQPSHERR